MLSTPHKFVYLHVPKTAGNSVQTVLLPFSDDHQTCAPGQNGRDRFGLQGPVTPRKHARLSEYEAALPGVTATHRIIISVRHPYTRAVSHYFSPNRWIKPDGTFRPVYWDEAAFVALLSKPQLCAATGFLRIAGEIKEPDIILHFETLQRDFTNAIATLGLPAGPAILPHVNRSAAEDTLRSRILASRALRDEVETFYQDDMDFFEYQTYRGGPQMPGT